MLKADEFKTLVTTMKNDTIQLSSYQLSSELREKIGPNFRRSIQKIHDYLIENIDEKITDGAEVNEISKLLSTTSPSQQSTQQLSTIKSTVDVWLKSIEYLYLDVEKFWRWTKGKDKSGRFRRKSILMTKAGVFETLWPELRRSVRFVYEKNYAAFFQSENRGKVPPATLEDGLCNICEKMRIKCECWYLVTQFRLCNERLLELKLLDRIAGYTLIEIARNTIEKHIEEKVADVFDEFHLDSVIEWVETALFKWLEEVYLVPRPKRSRTPGGRGGRSTAIVMATATPQTRRVTRQSSRASSNSSTPSSGVNIASDSPMMIANHAPPTAMPSTPIRVADRSYASIAVPPTDFLTSAVDGTRRGQFEVQKRRLIYFLHESHAHYLIDHLFDIVIDYPDSRPSLLDLKRCMQWASLRQRLTQRLRASLERRLLHPAVNTSDILSAYIQTVSSLRILDPSGVLMENVCQPVRQYLRQRPDTVRCIVSHLTDNGGLEMNSGYGGAGAGDQTFSFNDSGTAVLGVDDPMGGGHKEGDEDWRDYVPDPIDADPESTGRARRSADVISMLVGVYGSREQFVKEYCQLLAERLLRANSYNIDDELRYLELLKLRIGESELNQCEVMLKDVKDSQRIDSFVRSHPNMKDFTNVPISALIVSSYFWPQLKEERLELPDRVKTTMEAYAKCFEMQKASRTLDWKSNLGVVELELEIGGKQLIVHVTPVLASIIILFEKKDTWTADGLATELNVPLSALKRRMAWWTGVEIVRETPNGSYQLCAELPAASSASPSSSSAAVSSRLQRRFSCGLDDDDDDDDGEDAAEDAVDKVEQLETYWAYISGLLTSFDELPGERIHTLLRMFCSQGQEPTLDTVHQFLQRKVRDQYLIYVGGAYRLQKK